MGRMLLLRTMYSDGSWSERWMKSMGELDHWVGEHLAKGESIDLRPWSGGLELIVHAPAEAGELVRAAS